MGRYKLLCIFPKGTNCYVVCWKSAQILRTSNCILQYYILYHYLKFRFRINSIQGKMAIGRFAVKNNTLFSICFAHNWGEVFYFQSIYILCSLFTFVYHYSPRISYINTVSYNRIPGCIHKYCKCTKHPARMLSGI